MSQAIEPHEWAKQVSQASQSNQWAKQVRRENEPDGESGEPLRTSHAPDEAVAPAWHSEWLADWAFGREAGQHSGLTYRPLNYGAL